MVLTRRSSRLNPSNEPTPEAPVEPVKNEPAPTPTKSKMLIVDEDTPDEETLSDDDDIEVIENFPEVVHQVEENEEADEIEVLDENGLVNHEVQAKETESMEDESEDDEDEEDDEEEEKESDELEDENGSEEDEDEELEEEPPAILDKNQWTQLFEEQNFESLKEAVVWTTKLQKSWRETFEKHLGNGVEAFIEKIGGKTKIAVSKMHGFFFDGQLGAPHFLLFLMKRMNDEISAITHSPTAKWNVFRCLKVIQSALESSSEFRGHKVGQFHGGKKGMKTVKRAYQDLWLDVLKKKLPKKVLRLAVVHLSKSVLDFVPTPHLFAEFFFKIFKRGGIFAILAIDGIFELIVKHNFEFPDFYEYVYQQTTAQSFYTEHKWHFLKNIDKFLSSSHVPEYVVAGFLKRLSRLLLWAPLDAQESMLALIKNLLIRHKSLNILIHRDVPEKLLDDPYLEDRPLKDCRAFDSSLWEIKAMQSHWFPNVAKRANFIDRPTEKTESMVRIRDFSAYLAQLFERKYGEALASRNAHFEESQDMNDEDEENEENEREETKKDGRKRAKGSKKSGKRAKHEFEIQLRADEPTGQFFPQSSTVCDFNRFWTE
ncbi:unnamed protein product, partial [Mesorhabditis belari]|uniref:CCAAT-binding factor domain-containing protein n=1 Tax=Mesorhabditis belari TaxID=2138241 RepID=A0AAF3ECM3_9BILA